MNVNWPTGVITILQSDLTLISTSLYELDVNWFRLQLKDLEDSEEGSMWPSTHNHNTEITLSGVTYSRFIEILSPYTITFEDVGTPYTVKCSGANHNIADKKNINQVSLIVANSAGLITVSTSGGSGASAADIWSYANRALTDASIIADAVRTELTPELDHILTLQNGQGLDSTQATMLLEIYRLYGLDPTKPLVVTKTSRAAGAGINQTITGDSNTTTVTRV